MGDIHVALSKLLVVPHGSPVKRRDGGGRGGDEERRRGGEGAARVQRLYSPAPRAMWGLTPEVAAEDQGGDTEREREKDAEEMSPLPLPEHIELRGFTPLKDKYEVCMILPSYPLSDYDSAALTCLFVSS
jgi:hypothetical protein